ncbi:MAG TPA: YbaB/EbfC family nucleoid-associated protein [Caulobacteraceae bacterium]|nr:YbaB/EbfC family nucleoid-associated protein [Caulobacteraceae bacterium]
MKDLGSIMKQAQLMQERLADAQNKLAAMSMVGTSGGGMVKVRLSGTNVLEAVDIDPSLMEPGEAEVLADLIVAAHADAKRQLEAQQQSLMREAAGPLAGMNLPGLKL